MYQAIYVIVIYIGMVTGIMDIFYLVWIIYTHNITMNLISRWNKESLYDNTTVYEKDSLITLMFH